MKKQENQHKNEAKQTDTQRLENLLALFNQTGWPKPQSWNRLGELESKLREHLIKHEPRRAYLIGTEQNDTQLRESSRLNFVYSDPVEALKKGLSKGDGRLCIQSLDALTTRKVWDDYSVWGDLFLGDVDVREYTSVTKRLGKALLEDKKIETGYRRIMELKNPQLRSLARERLIEEWTPRKDAEIEEIERYTKGDGTCLEEQIQHDFTLLVQAEDVMRKKAPERLYLEAKSHLKYCGLRAHLKNSEHHEQAKELFSRSIDKVLDTKAQHVLEFAHEQGIPGVVQKAAQYICQHGASGMHLESLYSMAKRIDNQQLLDVARKEFLPHCEQNPKSTRYSYEYVEKQEDAKLQKQLWPLLIERCPPMAYDIAVKNDKYEDLPKIKDNLIKFAQDESTGYNPQFIYQKLVDANDWTTARRLYGSMMSQEHDMKHLFLVAGMEGDDLLRKYVIDDCIAQHDLEDMRYEIHEMFGINTE